jgi:MFS family permease
MSTFGPQQRLTLIVVALTAATGSFLLGQSLIMPVLPEVQRQLGTDQNTVTWVLTANLLSASIFTPIVGRIGDRVGKGRVLVCVLIALAAGSLICGLATNVPVMIIGRILQGVGGGVLPLAFGIIRDELPAAKVPGVVGLITSLSAAGAGLGVVVLAGPIDSLLGYQWLYWLPMVVTAVAAALIFFVIPVSPASGAKRIGVLPAVLLSGWLVCLLVAVSEGRRWQWDSVAVLVLFAAALLLAAAWVHVELHTDAPLIDMAMMRLPAVWTSNLVALLIGFALYGAAGFLPQLLQTPASTGYGFGASITEAGLLMLPWTGLMFVVGLLSARFVRQFGARLVVVIGCVLGSSGMAVIAVAHDERWQILLGVMFLGVGIGLIFSCLSNLVVGAVPRAQTGVATGMNANIRTIGGAIGAATMASIVTAQMLPSGMPQESGYTHGFLMLGVMFLLAAVVAMLIPRTNNAPG